MVSKSTVLGYGWHFAKRFLPYDLDGFAVESGVLQRRRGVRNGECLVRALCLCALPKSTFNLAAQSARTAHIADMSGTALYKRMTVSEPLTKGLFEHALGHVTGKAERWNGLRLLATDASALCGPGATGTDQRLHVVYDLGTGLPLSVDLTGPEGGETLCRHHSFGVGDLILADCGYGHAPGLKSALRTGARLLVRFKFESIRLLGEDGEKIWPEQAEGVVPDEGPVEFCVYLPDWVEPLRVIGARNLEGKTVWLLTDLSPDELPLAEARDLYSRRWQIELFFKRLKSLLDLGDLPTRDGPSARPWIWAKLLVATLAVLLADERFSPWEHGSEQMGDLRDGSLDDDGWSPVRSHEPQVEGKAKRQAKTQRQDPQTTRVLEVLS